MPPVLQALLGMAGLLTVAWSLSEQRRRVPWRAVTAGLLLQLTLAVLLLKVPLAKDAFVALNGAMLALERATEAGTSLVFGYLGGGPLPYSTSNPAASYVLAFRGLPLVLVISRSRSTCLRNTWRRRSNR